MTSTTGSGRRRNVIVTDLDQPDASQTAALQRVLEQVEQQQTQHRKATHRKRASDKTLHTISGNFNRRSGSAECQLQPRGTKPAAQVAGEAYLQQQQHGSKVQSYFNDLLQAKDKQMEKLLQRLATLHKYNEQFADENHKLRADVSSLEQQTAALRRQIAECAQCRQLSQQLAQALEQQRTLEADVDMMQTLVYRLNVQIEGYQDRLRAGKQAAGQAVVASGSDSAQQSSNSQWHTGALGRHTLAPLLQAYDEMIRDKEQLLLQYRQEFEHFTGELKRVLEENNRLLQQQEMLKRDVGSWREERTRLQAQLDVCRAKAEAQTHKSDLAKEKLVEVMHCYEQKMQTLVLDMEHLQSAYTRCKAELASLKSVAAQPQDVIAHSLQECKELLEQLRTQHTKEKQALERTIAELSERQSGSLDRTAKVRSENELLKQQLDAANEKADELSRRSGALQRAMEKVKRSRDRLKARLRIALQWAQKLEEGQANIQNTWDALKRLETIVKHKESQVRGLHARHLQEIEKMQRRLAQKEETIRTILKGKLEPVPSNSAVGER